MSTSSIVTRGYGADATISLIVLAGYQSEVVTVSDTVVRTRRKYFEDDDDDFRLPKTQFVYTARRGKPIRLVSGVAVVQVLHPARYVVDADPGTPLPFDIEPAIVEVVHPTAVAFIAGLLLIDFGHGSKAVIRHLRPQQHNYVAHMAPATGHRFGMARAAVVDIEYAERPEELMLLGVGY